MLVAIAVIVCVISTDHSGHGQSLTSSHPPGGTAHDMQHNPGSGFIPRQDAHQVFKKAAPTVTKRVVDEVGPFPQAAASTWRLPRQLLARADKIV